MRPLSRGVQISWKEADPIVSLKKAGKDSTILLICITETGQYSSSFYLRQVIGFRSVKIVTFIVMVGILFIVAQIVFLTTLMRSLGNKHTVLFGLGLQMFHLAWYAFGYQAWMMWVAGTVATMSSFPFPAVPSSLRMQSQISKELPGDHNWHKRTV